MKTFVCVRDRVFFNKKIYNFGDIINVDDELAKEIKTSWFEDKETWDKGREVVVKKVTAAQKEGKTIKEVITEAEEEKKKIKAELNAKIEKLEKQLNPKVKNDI
jgi:hypothetical protein